MIKRKDLKEEFMFIVHVFVHVKSNKSSEFKKETIEYAKESKTEPGIARFDVIQKNDDLTWFVIVEVYRTPFDHPAHKHTLHYKKWRDTVVDFMITPLSSIKYTSIYPDEDGWN
jgi:autoinducer 2-degrading protein